MKEKIPKNGKDRNSIIGQTVYFHCGICGDSFGDSDLVRLGRSVMVHKDGCKAMKEGREPKEIW
jgi:hypothetical protein